MKVSQGSVNIFGLASKVTLLSIRLVLVGHSLVNPLNTADPLNAGKHADFSSLAVTRRLVT